jgi:hypothetical protein
MTSHQGECSYRPAEEEEEDIRRFGVGRVLVLNDLSASLSSSLPSWLRYHAKQGPQHQQQFAFG